MWKFAKAAAAACMALALSVSSASGSPLEGHKTIKLRTNSGELHPIGQIEFVETGGAITYQVTWEETPFTDHFLSMRPFKCIEGPAKHWCYVPYPYENRRTVSADDLTDLEYDLLFIWKGATEYGINMWNGVYYRLKVENNRIVGHLHEMDMDVLSAPPDAGNLRPVREMDLEPSDPEGHWLPSVVIE